MVRYGLCLCIVPFLRSQGQQSDYIFFSLVRTQSVSHIHGVRCLAASLSRALLGLCVLCHQRLFESFYGLPALLTQLTARRTKLHIVPSDMYLTLRPVRSVSFDVLNICSDSDTIHSARRLVSTCLVDQTSFGFTSSPGYLATVSVRLIRW